MNNAENVTIGKITDASIAEAIEIGPTGVFLDKKLRRRNNYARLISLPIEELAAELRGCPDNLPACPNTLCELCWLKWLKSEV